MTFVAPLPLSHLQVFLSTRRGAWVMNRIGDRGMPIDRVVDRRVVRAVTSWLPFGLRNGLIENKLNARFDHELYGLRPQHRFESQHPMINDDLPNAIIAGAVVVKPNVRRMTETGLEFDDGSVIDNVDAVIYATGYLFGFPFVDHAGLRVTRNEVDLFKYVFPPDIRPSTIAIIGCIQPTGALFPISELQCRWATMIFKVSALLAYYMLSVTCLLGVCRI